MALLVVLAMVTVLVSDGIVRIAKVVANKGGLVCKLRLRGTTLCFVSCHLQVCDPPFQDFTEPLP